MKKIFNFSHKKSYTVFKMFPTNFDRKNSVCTVYTLIVLVHLGSSNILCSSKFQQSSSNVFYTIPHSFPLRRYSIVIDKKTPRDSFLYLKIQKKVKLFEACFRESLK